MGLFDNVLGAVLGAQQGQNAGAAGAGLNLATLLPMLTPVLTGLLANNGAAGGLSGLVAKFEQAGLGGVLNSWVGQGENQPISGSQLTQVLGSDTIAQIAGQLGLGHGDTAGALAQVLPGLIDKLTPQGQAPSGGLGGADELSSLLGSLLKH